MNKSKSIIDFIEKYQLLEIIFLVLFIFGIIASLGFPIIDRPLGEKILIHFSILSSSFTGFAILTLWSDTKQHFPYLNLEDDHMVFFMAVSMVIWGIDNSLTVLGFNPPIIHHIANTLNTGSIVVALRYIYFRPEDIPIWWNSNFFTRLRNKKSLFSIILTIILFTILFNQIQTSLPFPNFNWVTIPAVVFGLYCLIYIFRITNEIFRNRGFPFFSKSINLGILILLGIGQFFLIFPKGYNLPIPLRSLYTMGLQVLFLVTIISWYNYIRPERNVNMIRQMNHSVKDSLTALELDLINLNENIKGESKKYLTQAIKRIASARKLHNYLHSVSLKAFASNVRMPEGDQEVITLNICSYLNDILILFAQANNLNEHEFSFSIEPKNEKIWTVVPQAQALGIVLTELNTNALEACKSSNISNIKILNKIFFNQNKFNAVISDNGPGFSSTAEKGFGLIQVYSTINHYNGSISRSPNKDNGTKWEIKNIEIL